MQPDEESLGKIRRGWRFGEDDFLERMGKLEKGTTKKENYFGREYGEAMEVKGRRIIAEELNAQGVVPSALGRMNRTCAIKGTIAKKLLSETTLALKWIAKELSAGTVGTLANTIRKLNAGTV